MSALEPGMNEAIPADEPYVSMNVTWSPFAVSRKRTIYTRKCRLYSARSHYPVRIQNNTQDATISSAYNITSNIITLTGPSEPIEGSVQNVRKVVAETGLPIKVDPKWVEDGADTNQTLSILRPLTYFQGEGVCEEYPNAVGCPVYLTLGGLASAAAVLAMLLRVQRERHRWTEPPWVAGRVGEQVSWKRRLLLVLLALAQGRAWGGLPVSRARRQDHRDAAVCPW